MPVRAERTEEERKKEKNGAEITGRKIRKNGDGICDVIPVIGFRNAIIRQPDGLHP